MSGSLAGEAAPPVRQPLRKLVIDLIAYRTAPLLPVGVFPFRYLLAETFNLPIGPGLRPCGAGCLPVSHQHPQHQRPDSILHRDALLFSRHQLCRRRIFVREEGFLTLRAGIQVFCVVSATPGEIRETASKMKERTQKV